MRGQIWTFTLHPTAHDWFDEGGLVYSLNPSTRWGDSMNWMMMLFCPPMIPMAQDPRSFLFSVRNRRWIWVVPISSVSMCIETQVLDFALRDE